MKKLRKNEKAITLIALVVTIVVLLILAGVSISMLAGENGIIKQAQKSREETIKGEEKDFINLAVSAIKTNKISIGDTSGISKEELQSEMNNYTNEATISQDSSNTKTLIVTYNSGRKYEVDGSGNVGEVQESYDGMYSVGGLEGKIAPNDLFEYEYDIDTSGNSSKIATTEFATLPTKEARIISIKKEYCNTPMEENNSYEGYYEINYKGTKITDTLVIPYQVEHEGEMYTITEVNLATYHDDFEVALGHLPQVETIIYPNTVKKILSYAFPSNKNFYNDKTKNIILSKNLTQIGECMFVDCINLRNIVIPNGITKIGVYAFAGCSSLTSIEIPSSVTSIEPGAFNGCTSLTSITIPDNITNIGDSTFKGCSGLTSIKIPSNVTSIEGWAFYKCTNLTSITIPASVTSIGTSAFAECDGLTMVNYTGTEEQWKQITMGQYNDSLKNAKIIFN